MFVVMTCQPERPSMVGWLCNMHMIQFFKVIRFARGSLAYTCSQAVSLLDPTSANNAGEGIFALARLMVSSPSMHAFLFPDGARRFLASGGSASIFEAFEKNTVMKVYRQEYLSMMESEKQVLSKLPQLFAEAHARSCSMVKPASGSAAPGAIPPFLRLTEVIDVPDDGTAARTTILKLSPLCTRISRTSFASSTQVIRQQLVADFVNALSLMHGGKIHHGDIRPSNLMTADGRGIIIDFGLSEEVNGAQLQPLVKLDLARLVLTFLYWCTKDEAIFKVERVEDDEQVTGEYIKAEISSHSSWSTAVECAFACNYAGLAEQLFLLVAEPEKSALEGTSPPDVRTMRRPFDDTGFGRFAFPLDSAQEEEEEEEEEEEGE
jgi:serine/threonine protein kinase